MALIDLQDITLSFGGASVFDGTSLQIEPGERVCLVGRNGEGKSTLMKLIAGEIRPDSGKLFSQQGLVMARLSQEVPDDIRGTIYDVVAGGLGDLLELLAKHHSLINRLAEDGGERLLDDLATVEHEMESTDAWQAEQRIETVLSRLQLDADLSFASLSGGMKRRVLLARVLVADPDLLLLDEPTNHLDIEAITWLEEFLLNTSCAILFVTHDRELLKKLATRILDLERGQLTSWPGNYANYLRRKEELLAEENGHNARFDKKLAEEEIWIRKGVKARRTRNEGRVRQLQEMRRQRQERRQQLGQVKMSITEGGASGKLVAVIKEASFSYDGNPVIKDLTCTVMRGDRIGVIGPNGAGKTTLLRMMLGEFDPTAGEVKLGTNLKPVYFDQQRAQLDQAKSVAENIGEGSDFIEINGHRRHVIGYLGDFLFTPDRARSPVSILSGGERNRLLLARIFAKPSNVLVLDEPTNDLDMETLDLLEELLLEYKGTVLLVSHDRSFINSVVTSTLVFEGHGRVQEYAGGYDDWLQQRAVAGVHKPAKKKEAGEVSGKKAASPRKLTFKENRELEDLPKEIGVLEKEQQTLYDKMADPAFYQGEGAVVAETKERLEELAELLAEYYQRWEDLEAVNEEYLAWKKN